MKPQTVTVTVEVTTHEDTYKKTVTANQTVTRYLPAGLSEKMLGDITDSLQTDIMETVKVFTP